MKKFDGLRALMLAGLATLPMSGTAQTQPPAAINQQDEVVTIHLAPGKDPGDVLEILRTDDKFESNKYLTRAFELHHAGAYELSLVVGQAVSQEKGVVRTALTRPPDDSAPRAFVV
ncbi:hypothetical protein HZA57_08070, partial [Candidatus Poribacteria bacterium]|nr:hypothetical protein [Candidatus Poribacteria bacterium]